MIISKKKNSFEMHSTFLINIFFKSQIQSKEKCNNFNFFIHFVIICKNTKKQKKKKKNMRQLKKKASKEWKKIKELIKREAAVEFLCAVLYTCTSQGFLNQKFFNLKCKNKIKKTKKTCNFYAVKTMQTVCCCLWLVYFFVNVCLCSLLLYVRLSTQIKYEYTFNLMYFCWCFMQCAI